MSIDFDSSVLVPAFSVFGINAVFTPSGESSVNVKLIRVNDAAESIDGFYGGTRVKSDSRIYDMRKDSDRAPAIGDVLSIGGTDYVIDDAHLKDSQGMIWRIEVVPA